MGQPTHWHLEPVIIALILASTITKAQSCKIVIAYDDNGYRVLRTKSCARSENTNDSTKNSNVDSSGNTYALAMGSGKYEIFPNPSSDIVDIRLDEISLNENCSFILTDATGKQIRRETINSSNTVLELNAYADGTYFIILQRGKQTNTIKIIKQYGAGK